MSLTVPYGSYKWTTIISLHDIHWLVFVIDRAVLSVRCELNLYIRQRVSARLWQHWSDSLLTVAGHGLQTGHEARRTWWSIDWLIDWLIALQCDLEFNAVIEAFSRYNNFLRVEGSGLRTPILAGFSVPFQTVLKAHPVFCTLGIGSLPWTKPPGPGVDHPTSS